MNEKVELLKKSFKKQFLKLGSKFNDNRKIDFLKDNEKRKFWFLPQIKNEYVVVSWSETLIEVRFNDNLIFENFIKNQNFDTIKLQNYFKRVANHEYGHTISCKSVFYFYFPEDTRHLLLSKDLESITEEDIGSCFRSSNSEYIQLLRLKNVDVGSIQRIFLEFWANLIVYEQIDDSPPNELLNKRLKDFTSSNILSYAALCNPTVKYNENIFRLLEYTGEFFIFNEWENLIKLFTSRNLNKLLDFFNYINSFFQKIKEINYDFDSVREDLLELIKILNKIDYNEIVAKNVISSKDRQLIRFYIKYLKNKE